MHFRNKLAFGILVTCLLNGILAQAQDSTHAQPTQDATQRIQPSTLPAEIDPRDPAVPVWMRPAKTNSGTKGNTNPANPTPANTGKEVIKEGSNFVLRTQVEEVVLPVTVVDRQQHLVTNLSQSDFLVYEEEQPQRITGFKHEDIPVSIGIVVDNSGSMRQKRAAVTKAVVNLVKASNPQDEVFVVNFSEEPYLDQDFTADVNLMRKALDRLDSHGSTALYDAVFAAAEHLSKGAHREKKVLLVITDGEDNGSAMSLEEAIRSVQHDKGPVVYSIGILASDGKGRRAKQALEALSQQTGGVAFL
jgi:Ca-activated chloride channel family protein